MTTIYLIRHAEAEGNLFRRLHGQYNSRLTPNGLRQVAALAERFREIPIDAVYTSDLCRTRQTAEAICGPKKLTAVLDPRFREVNAGAWENRTFGDLARTEPEALDFFIHKPEQWTAPGAETYEQYAARFADGLRAAAEACDGKTIAVFSHGCVMSGALHYLLGVPHNASKCDNTGVSLLHWEDGRLSAEYLYDNSHLSEALSTRARQRWWREQGGRFELWFRDAEWADRSWFDRDFFPQKGHEIRIAMLGEEAVGYVCWHGNSISTVYLKPDCRHRRIGDQLLGEVVMHLRAAGANSLSIGVPTVNLEALEFFSRHGVVPEQMDDVYTAYRWDISVPYPL